MFFLSYYFPKYNETLNFIATWKMWNVPQQWSHHLQGHVLCSRSLMLVGGEHL